MAACFSVGPPVGTRTPGVGSSGWEEAEPGRGQLWVALRVLRAAVAVVVVSYSSYIPLVFPKPPVKSC